jgi:hypothetical protein
MFPARNSTFFLDCTNGRILLANPRACPQMVLVWEGRRRLSSPDGARGGLVMSLKPHVSQSVPEATAHVARAAFPHGSPALTCRDALGTSFQEADGAALFPSWGQPGRSPWRRAWITILQGRAPLADRHAAEAVRARIAWKFLRSLE